MAELNSVHDVVHLLSGTLTVLCLFDQFLLFVVVLFSLVSIF